MNSVYTVLCILYEHVTDINVFLHNVTFTYWSVVYSSLKCVNHIQFCSVFVGKCMSEITE